MLAGAAASLELTWILFDPSDASRAYYGTDTHAAGLLLVYGDALALVWAPGSCSAPSRSLVRAGSRRCRSHRLGLPDSQLASAAVIAVIAHPTARLGGLLARPALVWLGLRSYSFYLWHWPMLALTRPGLDVALPRGVLIPLQLLVVFALADLSYRFVELPFRGKRKLPAMPENWLRVGRPRSHSRWWRSWRWSAGVAFSRPAAAISRQVLPPPQPQNSPR